MRKLILWDIDGTLLNCGSDGTEALNKTFKDMYGVEDAFLSAGIGSKMDYDIIRNIMESNDIYEKNFDNIKKCYCENLEFILKEDHNKTVLPGIERLLEEIESSPKFYQTLITSNLKEGAMIKLRSVGLDRYFKNKAGGFGDTSEEKWHVCESLIRSLGFSIGGNNIFLIGDGIYDIETSKRLGLVSIAVATGWVDKEKLSELNPDYMFDNFSKTEELKKILGL